MSCVLLFFFFFQAEDGIRDYKVTGVQTCALPICHVLLCLNAPEMGTQFLTSQMQEVAPELEFVERLANPATFADIDAERSLKVLVYRAPATPAAADTAS